MYQLVQNQQQNNRVLERKKDLIVLELSKINFF